MADLANNPPKWREHISDATLRALSSRKPSPLWLPLDLSIYPDLLDYFDRAGHWRSKVRSEGREQVVCGLRAECSAVLNICPGRVRSWLGTTAVSLSDPQYANTGRDIRKGWKRGLLLDIEVKWRADRHLVVKRSAVRDSFYFLMDRKDRMYFLSGWCTCRQVWHAWESETIRLPRSALFTPESFTGRSRAGVPIVWTP